MKGGLRGGGRCTSTISRGVPIIYTLHVSTILDEGEKKVKR